VEKVGVFVNESPERVSETADQAGLTAVQFHGDEYKKPEQYALGEKQFFCLPMVEIIREMRGHTSFFYGFPSFPKDARVLLDSGGQQERGGTGRMFAWGEAHGFISALRKLYPVVIAGGLSSSNVGWAIEFLRPWGVDVVSGVEAAPGKKDPEKVRAFVKAVRDFDRKVG
jgi:phosphoribosylanthranilate isomerase